MGTTTAMSARSLQYYVIADRWASDIEFFKTETDFLYRLIDEYFIRFCEQTYIENFKKICTDLLKLEADKNHVDVLLTDQRKHLELMVEDVIPEETDILVNKQIKLEYLIADLATKYREVKKELFALVETIRKIKAG
jgi:hypothetical protein